MIVLVSCLASAGLAVQSAQAKASDALQWSPWAWCTTNATPAAGSAQFQLGGGQAPGATVVEAWGANGGMGGGEGSPGQGGYARTTFASSGQASPRTAYAYVGCPGQKSSSDYAGGGGGAATVVTFQAFNATTGFSTDPADFVVVAGGGGGLGAKNSGDYGGLGAGATGDVPLYQGQDGDSPGEGQAQGGAQGGNHVHHVNTGPGPVGSGGPGTPPNGYVAICDAAQRNGMPGFGGAGGAGVDRLNSDEENSGGPGGTWGFDLGEYEPHLYDSPQLAGWGGNGCPAQEFDSWVFAHDGGGGGGGGFGGGGGAGATHGAGGGSFTAFGQYQVFSGTPPLAKDQGPDSYARVTQYASPEPSGDEAPAPIGRSRASGTIATASGKTAGQSESSQPSGLPSSGWVPLFHNLLNDSAQPLEIESIFETPSTTSGYCYTSDAGLTDSRMPGPLPQFGLLPTVEAFSYETYSFWWNSASKIYQSGWNPQTDPSGGKDPAPLENVNDVKCNNPSPSQALNPTSSTGTLHDYEGDSNLDSFYFELAPAAIPDLQEPLAVSSSGAQSNGQLSTTPYWTPSWDDNSKTVTFTGPSVSLSEGLSLVSPSTKNGHASNPRIVDTSWGSTSGAPATWGNTSVFRFDIQGPTYTFSAKIPDKLAMEPYKVYGTTSSSCSRTDQTQSCWTPLGDLLPVSPPSANGPGLELPDATFFWENCQAGTCSAEIQSYSGFLVSHEFEGKATTLFIDPSQAEEPKAEDVGQINKVDNLPQETFTMLNNGSGALPLGLQMESNGAPLSQYDPNLGYLYDYFYLREYDGSQAGRVITNLYSYNLSSQSYDRPLAITSLPAQHTQPITTQTGMTYNITTWQSSGKQLEALPIYGPEYASGTKRWTNTSLPLQLTPTGTSSTADMSNTNIMVEQRYDVDPSHQYVANFTDPGAQGGAAMFHDLQTDPASPALGLLSSFTAHTDSLDFYTALARCQPASPSPTDPPPPSRKIPDYMPYGFRPLKSHRLAVSGTDLLSIGDTVEPDEPHLAAFFVADDGTPFLGLGITVTPSPYEGNCPALPS